MGQSPSKTMARDPDAFFHGSTNGGHAKVALNGSHSTQGESTSSLSNGRKTARSSDRKKRDKKGPPKYESAVSRNFVSSSKLIGSKLADESRMIPNGKIVRNGNIVYRNVMKDSASETEDTFDSDRSVKAGLNGGVHNMRRDSSDVHEIRHRQNSGVRNDSGYRSDSASTQMASHTVGSPRYDQVSSMPQRPRDLSLANTTSPRDSMALPMSSRASLAAPSSVRGSIALPPAPPGPPVVPVYAQAKHIEPLGSSDLGQPELLKRHSISSSGLVESVQGHMGDYGRPERSNASVSGAHDGSQSSSRIYSCVSRLSGNYDNVNSPYDTIAHVEDVNRRFEDFVTRLRSEADNSSRQGLSSQVGLSKYFLVF